MLYSLNLLIPLSSIHNDFLGCKEVMWKQCMQQITIFKERFEYNQPNIHSSHFDNQTKTLEGGD